MIRASEPQGNRSVGCNMLVDSSSQHGSVVLRGVEIDLDTAAGQGFVVDCCRFCEGLLAENQIKTKYKLTDTHWAGLAENELLVQTVQREKERRIANGAATREKAQHLFLATPDVLNGIIQDANLSPRPKLPIRRCECHA